MASHYQHLSFEERRKIAKWREGKMPVPEIADRLSRPPSTIYRELKRNTYLDAELAQYSGYYAVTAQDKYERRRAVHRKLVAHPELKAAVEDALKAGWSPEQIAGRMRLEQHRICVSHETIYRFAYSKLGIEEAFYRHLPEHRRRRRPRHHRRHQRSHIQDSQSLCHRPLMVAERQQFGHWECDLMMFRKENGKVNVTSLVERVSRFTVAMRNEDRHSEPIMEALIAGLAPLPAEARQSITFDRGTEFSAWRRLTDGIGAVSWFCDPQAPWQKGTVENTNGRLRKHLPRSTEPTALTNRYLRSICQSLNSTPRKCLGYRTPAEVFESNLMAIRNRLE
ncbi:IS30 family transposase (plasmid) [Paracoccus yeei]|uniref:IS30 family transposase n=1 Tax=Paracoccus yeei TaxID=147645 RepID=A0A386UTW6_9RHOB|nr:IS30 family transposase [Paracoccus yeei]AYF03133.1 IS30 family transposase [Paracoccus yeei]AYF04094.1 IS30 family transposase [Paracoccus yeei]